MTIATSGVHVEEDGAAWSVPVATALLDDTLGPADVVLVLVKSPQTAAVAGAAAQALAADGLLVTLQNGLGNRETLEAAVRADRPRAAVTIGVATLGATLVGPGRVRAFPGQVTLGSAPPVAERVQAFAALLRHAGVATEVSPDIERLVWRKLAVNCAINPLSVLLGVPNGALAASPLGRDTLAGAAREVAAVAAARGLDLGVDPAELALDVARRTADNLSSMLQDVARGAPTEIDALCGAVVREGRRLGVPTPLNASLLQQVRHRDARRSLAGAGR